MKELKDIKKVLVINLGGIGDILISTPALRAIKERFAGAELYLLVVSRAKEIVSNLAYVDKIFIFEADRPVMKLSANLSSLLELRKLKIDLAINMRTMVSNAGAAKMNLIMDLIAPGIKAGRDTASRGKFLDIKIPEQDIGEKYEMDYDIETARALGAEVNDRSIDLAIDPASVRRAEELLQGLGIDQTDALIGIHPGGKPSHRWPENNFVEVIKVLGRENPKFKFIITGDFDEIDLGKRIIAGTKINVVNLAGKLNLQELASVLKRCGLYITNDTGSMHIAGIVKTPMVAIFGPGYFERYDPRNINPQAEVLYKKIDCSPCNKSVCTIVKCLESISTEEVVSAAKRLLSRGKG